MPLIRRAPRYTYAASSFSGFADVSPFSFAIRYFFAIFADTLSSSELFFAIFFMIIFTFSFHFIIFFADADADFSSFAARYAASFSPSFISSFHYFSMPLPFSRRFRHC
jgi:hypothetical protein